MNLSLVFIRAFFVLLSVVFMSAHFVAKAGSFTVQDLALGGVSGLLVGGALIGLESIFRRFNLRSFNVATLGLLFGYLMGEALALVFKGLLDLSGIDPMTGVSELVRIFLYLLGTYLGLVMTLRASDELHVSIPFVRFSSTSVKKKDLLIDITLLSDGRLLDLAATGLLDELLILPQFVQKELLAQSESSDEQVQKKARRSLETIKKLEAIPYLGLKIHDTDFPEVKEGAAKILRLAKLLHANIFTADSPRLQIAGSDNVRIINIHALSNALKPITQSGEHIKVRIQRYGKEARQGVGYLDDGTMVVVNGGGDYIGETLEVRVLSVKHTSAGRLIFCNADDSSLHEGDYFDDE